MSEEKVLGFQFEPVRKRSTRPSTDSESSWESCYEDEDGRVPDGTQRKDRRTDIPVEAWCKCGKCSEMPSEEECLCCTELDSAQLFEQNDKITCITDHEHFHPIVILKEALWTALVGMHDREASHLPHRNNVPTRTYRYASYRQFTWWVHNRTGKGVRRVIPSCVVQTIRKEYPASDGVYVGYKEGQAMNEVELSWGFRDEISD